MDALLTSLGLNIRLGEKSMLLGTGGAMTHPPRAFIRAMEERGIGVEVMDSRAAARAWRESPEYRAILPIREATSTSRVYIVDGYEG